MTAGTKPGQANGTLWFGDNLEIMRGMEDESVDLIYLDPPFNSDRAYNVNIKGSNEQIMAFDDTWSWGPAASDALDQITGNGGTLACMVCSLFEALGKTDMMAYLVMMSIRLSEMKRVLKDTGSIFVHCDPTASHYLKVVLDSIFNIKNFRNEIVWKRASAHPLSIKKFAAVTDSILVYQKSDRCFFRSVMVPLDREHVEGNYKEDENGRLYISEPLTGGKRGGESAYLPFRGALPSTGRGWAPPTRKKLPSWVVQMLPHNYEQLNQVEKCEALDDIGLIEWSKNRVPRYRHYLRDDKAMQATNIWTDIKPLTRRSREYLGYQTQKPRRLLERVIESATTEGDLVLDPFCGCGTAVYAAQMLSRRWIGIDITHLAVNIMQDTLQSAFPGIKIDIRGVPTTLQSAKELFSNDPFQFETWAVSLIRGMAPTKKTGDRGVDGLGRIRLGNDKYGTVVVSVKGGKTVGPRDVRDMRGTMDTKRAVAGILICMKEPTKEMILALDTEYFETQWSRHPRMQIYTTQDYFDGKRPDLPDLLMPKRAHKEKVRRGGEQKRLKVGLDN